MSIEIIPHYFTPYIFGTYLLRTTNNVNIKSKYTYLIVNDKKNIKIKTIQESGFLATKTSKRGTVEIIPNFKNLISYIFKKSSYDIRIVFNNVNKYSYSYFGIEFPEIKYKQISNYSSEIKLTIDYKHNTIFMVDEDKFYYVFDLYPYIKTNKLPYIEMPFNTFLFSQLLSFVINLLLVRFFNTYER